jgi:hypothetical protein
MNHDEANCPSPKQTRRIEDVMEVLIRILRARGNPESSSTATQLPAKPKSDDDSKQVKTDDAVDVTLLLGCNSDFSDEDSIY